MGFFPAIKHSSRKRIITVETFGLLCMGQRQEAEGFLCLEGITKKQCGLFLVLPQVCVVLLPCTAAAELGGK